LPSKLKTLDVRTRGLALEFGRVFDAQPARILDYSSSTTKPELVPVRIASEIADRVFTSKNIAATFNGWSHRLDPDNPLVFPLLTALPVAVGQCPDKVGLDRCIPPYGADNVIASALQTRVDSRVTIVSGNHWFQTMNQPGEELLMWTFQKSGQLRVDSYTHRNLEGRNDGRGYRIGDHVELRICLSTGKLGGWESTQPKDMQMELTMLDAWLRADLLPTSDGCLSTGPVKLPDRYGTYSLKVRYQRRGWPHLIKREIFIVRPFHHDEAQRHVTAALPYYLAWFGMMISSAFFVFPLIFPVKKDY
jgi:oligosaccharyltransferase complex subunit beta